MKMVAIENIERIKELWKQIDHKRNFAKELGEKVGKSFRTLESHWFSEFNEWSIPKDEQERVIREMEKTISEQNRK